MLGFKKSCASPPTVMSQQHGIMTSPLRIMKNTCITIVQKFHSSNMLQREVIVHLLQLIDLIFRLMLSGHHHDIKCCIQQLKNRAEIGQLQTSVASVACKIIAYLDVQLTKNIVFTDSLELVLFESSRQSHLTSIGRSICRLTSVDLRK